jgi:hypothetical protein
MIRFCLSSHLKIISCILSALVILSGTKANAQAELKISAAQTVAIVLPQQAIPSEETAAQELQHYLAQITGAKFKVMREGQTADLKGSAIYVGPTEFSKRHLKNTGTYGAEEWALKTQGNALILTGGRPRGTLYAAYHFLEDVGGVRWWNPWEEFIPKREVLPIPALDKRGQPAFRYRNIYMIYGNDDGHFAARSRLNSTPMAAAYGGDSEYSLPSAHSFFQWLPPEKYFKDHPDWYLVPGGGTPTLSNAQLCLSNTEMRAELLKVLREKICADRAKALAENVPPPKLYDVSQNDNRIGFVCGDNKALVEKEGAESAALLDFINYLADGIKDEFPDVIIDTLAYYSGEKAPKTMRARDNVMIVLADTESNLLLPITAERNSHFRNNVEQWATRCKYLRVWDYALTYLQPHIPTPTMHTYPTDLQFLLAHNGEGEFIEFEEPLQTDLRDMKLWMLAKMLENPHQDYNALVRDFTDGFYGPAGTFMRQYLTALETAAKQSKADVDWFAPTSRFTYLTWDFLQKANGIYDQAAQAVKGDPVFSRRVRDARSSLDTFILQRYARLTQQWVAAGSTPDTMPLDREAIIERYRQRWNEQIEMRVAADSRAAEQQKADAAIAALVASSVYVPLPARFKAVPADNLFLYSSHEVRKDASVKTVADPDAESGAAMRYEIPDNELEKYKLPMQWGIYDEKLAQQIAPPGLIQAADVPDGGYHWFAMKDVTLTSGAYLYFFWSWIIQMPVDDAFDAANPNAKFDVWISVKFSGPAFPHGKADDKNAISIERVVVVKK